MEETKKNKEEIAERFNGGRETFPRDIKNGERKKKVKYSPRS